MNRHCHRALHRGWAYLIFGWRAGQSAPQYGGSLSLCFGATPNLSGDLRLHHHVIYFEVGKRYLGEPSA